ncbi:MAG: glycosyltransferase family 9 protein [Ignavibacteriaceae bacterium]|nr:glycosyltransferase family 9 protein [Ignavibacteriaceae bacterium]
MKYKKARLPITDLINCNRILSLIMNNALILFFTAIRFVNKLFKYKNGSFVIISLHRLGDTIFTIPAVRELQKLYGQKIQIICFPESIPIYKIEFNDLQVCPIMHNEFRFGERHAKHSAISKLKDLKPEIILDLTGSMISASLIYNIKAKQIIGINRKQFSSIYDHFVPVREEPQLVDLYLDAISPITQTLSRTESQKNKKLINPIGKIVIHPFAGWKEKEWNLKSFITLADRLNANYSVSLITQNGQLSNDVISEIDCLNIELIQTNSVEELIKGVEECSFFIGNDSGPVNIANFLGKPTLSIYGSTNPEYTASEADHQIFIQKLLGCSSRQNEKYCSIGAAIYDCPGIQCMNSVTVDEVYDRVIPLLKEYCKKKT